MKITPLKYDEMEDFLHEKYGIEKTGRKITPIHNGKVVKTGSFDYGFPDGKGRKLGMAWRIYVIARTWVDGKVVHLEDIELYAPQVMQIANDVGTGGHHWTGSGKWYGTIEECEVWIQECRDKWEKKKRERYST